MSLTEYNQPVRAPAQIVIAACEVPLCHRVEVAAEVVAAEPVSVSVLAEEVVEVAVVVEAAVVPTSVDKLGRRKAMLRRQHQRESLYPRSVGDHYCG